MADRGDAIKMSIDPKSKGIVRRLVGILVRGKRGNQREKAHPSRKTRNQQLAVRFFAGRSEHDDETLSSSTLSPTFAKEIQEVCIDDFKGCLPTLHGEEDFSIASIFSCDDGELHELNEEAIRRREWKESAASQLRPVLVSHFIALLFHSFRMFPHSQC